MTSAIRFGAKERKCCEGLFFVASLRGGRKDQGLMVYGFGMVIFLMMVMITMKRKTRTMRMTSNTESSRLPSTITISLATFLGVESLEAQRT